MNSLVVLVAFVGSALAAPQVAYKPAPYQAYQPLPIAAPYSTPYAKVPYKPVAYSAAVAPAYVKPAAYSAPQYAYTPQVSYAAQPAYSAQYVKPIAIVRQSQDDNFDGSFTHDFEAENGIAYQASGYLKNAGTDAEAQVIQGQYSYTSPDGTPIVTRFYADETGFHADGAHIPTAPADPYRTL